MTVQMVRFTASEANVADIETASEAMTAAIHEAQPIGTRFASCKLADGVTFPTCWSSPTAWKTPCPESPSARRFTQQLPSWVAESPAPQAVTVVASYQLFE